MNFDTLRFCFILRGIAFYVEEHFELIVLSTSVTLHLIEWYVNAV